MEVGHEFYDDFHPFYVYGNVFDFILLIHSSTYYSVVEVKFYVQYFPCYFLQLEWMRLCCSPMRHCLYLAAHGITYNKLFIGVYYDDHVLLIMDEMSWANHIIIDGGEILGGLLFILPLEGKNFASHDQHTL